MRKRVVPNSDTVIGLGSLSSSAYYFLVILFSSELVANASDDLKRWYQPAFIGGFLLSLLDNIPDIFVVAYALLANLGSVSANAILGGNALAFTLGYSLVITANLYSHGGILHLSKDVRRHLSFLIVATLVILASYFLGARSWIAGGFMIILFGFYAAAGIRSETGRSANIRRRLASYSEREKKVAKSMVSPSLLSIVKVALTLGVALFLFVYTTGPFVRSVLEVGRTFGLPVLFISSVIIPIVTESPELVSGFILSRRSSDSAVVAVSSMIGSKVQSNTLILGLVFVIGRDLGRPVFLSGYSTLALILVNLYAYRASFDLELTKTDALVSLGLYPLVVSFLLFFH